MNTSLSNFAAQLRRLISRPGAVLDAARFDVLARELFALQFAANPAYRRVCEARQQTPAAAGHWTEIPCVPTAAFKEFEFSSLPPAERTAVFHSSGTTEQKPSRHFHGAESLALYEASLWSWFQVHFSGASRFVFLTPGPAAAPRSSLVHMFETVRKNTAAAGAAEFFGRVAADGAWELDFAAVIPALRSASTASRPVTVLGTAFSFVHLLDHLAENKLSLQLPENSRVMETGGYKNRSRTMPKSELHGLITRHVGVPRARIICEYGMSELSSQAYDSAGAPDARGFHFPPWARARIISPETGREVAEGETGLIRILDLANAFSVAAIQTEDLGVRRGGGVELLGRAQRAEPRGCSLMTA
jgi:hypothetical protein